MADTPHVGIINAEKVVVAHEIHGGIHAERVTVLTFPSGQRIKRAFANVPRQGPELIGRDKLFAEMRERVVEGGRLALYGLPGAGKTALAHTLAYDEAVLKRFSGGVFWASLGPNANVDNILNLWGSAVGADVGVDVNGKPLRTLAERAQRLNTYLQSALEGKPFLVVLDDAWKPEDFLDFEYFTTLGSATLLTARDQGLARRFVDAPRRLLHVRELDEEDALDLLSRAVPEARTAHPEGLRQLARAVGCLPLALSLMGNELAVHSGQERWIRTTVENLRSAEARLALTENARRPGLAGVPLSLQAVVELSLDALPNDATRIAFAKLGVFAPKPADFSRVDTLAMWQADERIGDADLRTLCERGLLEIAAEDRFTLHQVLSAVALARLEARPEDREAAAARHFAYYLSVVDADREAWPVILTGLAQIQHAWDWAASASEHDERVLDLVWAMHLFMERRGLWDQHRAWFDRALQAAQRLHRPKDEAAVWHRIGQRFQAFDEGDAALDRYQRALAIRRAIGDREGEAATLNNIGGLYMRRDRAAALDHYQQALAIRRAVGDRQGEAATLNNIGTMHYGDEEAALGYFRQALTAAREARERRGEGVTLNNMGLAYSRMRDWDRSLDSYQQALAIRRAVGDRTGEAFTLNNIGVAYFRRGDAEAALAYLHKALPITREVSAYNAEFACLEGISRIYGARGDRDVGDRAGWAATLTTLGNAYKGQKETDAALDHYRRALAIRQELGDREGEATSLTDLAILCQGSGDWDAALGYYASALDLRRQANDRRHAAALLYEIGRIYNAQGYADAALRDYREALNFWRELGDPSGEAKVLNNIGVVFQAKGDLDAALDHFRRSLTMTRDLGGAKGEDVILCNIAFVQEKRGEPGAALRYYEEAEAIAGFTTNERYEMVRRNIERLRKSADPSPLAPSANIS